MSKQGRMLIISGPSGTGKGSVVTKLLERGDFWLSVSMTTRDPRNKEVDGVNYHFKTVEEFEKIIGENGFLEYACYSGNYYGTPAKPVLENLENGVNVILEIDVQGALRIKEKYPDVLMIMISPPTYSNLERRLRDRNDTSESDIVKRLSKAKGEIAALEHYGYLVVNYDGKLDETAKLVLDIFDGVEYVEYLAKNNLDFPEKFNQ